MLLLHMDMMLLQGAYAFVSVCRSTRISVCVSCVCVCVYECLREKQAGPETHRDKYNNDSQVEGPSDSRNEERTVSHLLHLLAAADLLTRSRTKESWQPASDGDTAFKTADSRAVFVRSKILFLPTGKSLFLYSYSARAQRRPCKRVRTCYGVVQPTC